MYIFAWIFQYAYQHIMKFVYGQKTIFPKSQIIKIQRCHFFSFNKYSTTHFHSTFNNKLLGLVPHLIPMHAGEFPQNINFLAQPHIELILAQMIFQHQFLSVNQFQQKILEFEPIIFNLTTKIFHSLNFDRLTWKPLSIQKNHIHYFQVMLLI